MTNPTLTSAPKDIEVAADLEAFATSKGFKVETISRRNKFERDVLHFAIYGVATLSTFDVWRFARERNYDIDFRLATAADLNLNRDGSEYEAAFVISNTRRPCDVHDVFASRSSEAVLGRHLREQRIDFVRADGGFITDAEADTIQALAAEWNVRPRHAPIDLTSISVYEKEIDGEVVRGGTYFSLIPMTEYVPLKQVLAA